MMQGDPLRLPLNVGPGARAGLAVLSAVSAFGLFALLPVTDAVQQSVRPTLRLTPAPVAAPARRNPRPRLDAGRSAAGGAAAKAIKPPPSPTPVPRLAVRNMPRLNPASLRLPAGAFDLPDEGLSHGVGDFTGFFRVLSDVPLPASPEPAPAPKPFTLRDLDAPPRLLSRVRPLYPLAAKQRKIEGYADIEFHIEPDGSVSALSVLGGEPAGVFDAAACAAVRRWTFSAPVKDGKPVRVLARQRIEFTLEKP